MKNEKKKIISSAKKKKGGNKTEGWGDLRGGERQRERWGLMIDTNHIFPERSLHRQTAALCCSANVPHHNSSWFSSSISFYFGSRPFIWRRETFPPAPPTQYQSRRWHSQTMRAAPVLITTLSDKMKNKPAASYASISNVKWHEQVRDGWHKQIRREGMCDRTRYHLVLGPGRVALYSVVSALL